jgi:hypothetical protein
MCILPSREIGICLYVLSYYYISDAFMTTVFTSSAALCFKNKCQTLVAVIVNSCKLTLRFIAKNQWVFIH